MSDADATRLASLASLYATTLELVEALPSSRQKSLARTRLEDSYVAAMFAASGIENPIRPLDSGDSTGTADTVRPETLLGARADIRDKEGKGQ